MLTFEKLTYSQRKWVLMVQLYHPEIVDSITFDQIHKFHNEFLLLRDTDAKYKIGLPNWLIKANRIGKGLYMFPAAGNAAPVVHEDDKEELTELETEYQAFLKLHNFGENLTAHVSVL